MTDTLVIDGSHGIVIYGDRALTQRGDQNATNTPNSMRIVAPGTFVSSCMVYGNIEVVSGLGGRPVFAGIKSEALQYTCGGVRGRRSVRPAI